MVNFLALYVLTPYKRRQRFQGRFVHVSFIQISRHLHEFRIFDGKFGRRWYWNLLFLGTVLLTRGSFLGARYKGSCFKFYTIRYTYIN